MSICGVSVRTSLAFFAADGGKNRISVSEKPPMPGDMSTTCVGVVGDEIVIAVLLASIPASGSRTPRPDGNRILKRR